MTKYEQMYVVPKGVYNKFELMKQKPFKNPTSSVNIEQLNNFDVNDDSNVTFKYYDNNFIKKFHPAINNLILPPLKSKQKQYFDNIPDSSVKKNKKINIKTITKKIISDAKRDINESNNLTAKKQVPTKYVHDETAKNTNIPLSNVGYRNNSSDVRYTPIPTQPNFVSQNVKEINNPTITKGNEDEKMSKTISTQTLKQRNNDIGTQMVKSRYFDGTTQTFKPYAPNIATQTKKSPEISSIVTQTENEPEPMETETSKRIEELIKNAPIFIKTKDPNIGSFVTDQKKGIPIAIQTVDAKTGDQKLESIEEPTIGIPIAIQTFNPQTGVQTLEAIKYEPHIIESLKIKSEEAKPDIYMTKDRTTTENTPIQEDKKDFKPEGMDVDIKDVIKPGKLEKPTKDIIKPETLKYVPKKETPQIPDQRKPLRRPKSEWIPLKKDIKKPKKEDIFMPESKPKLKLKPIEELLKKEPKKKLIVEPKLKLRPIEELLKKEPKKNLKVEPIKKLPKKLLKEDEEMLNVEDMKDAISQLQGHEIKSNIKKKKSKQLFKVDDLKKNEKNKKKKKKGSWITPGKRKREEQFEKMHKIQKITKKGKGKKIKEHLYE